MVTGKRPQFNLMVDPYTEQMLARGVGGAPMTRLEALKAKKTPTFQDDPKTLMDNLFKGGLFGLSDLFEAGGPRFASMPYVPPKNVQEATEQIQNVFQIPGEEMNTTTSSEINNMIGENTVSKEDRLNFKKPEVQDLDSALAQNIPAEDERAQREKTQKQAITSLAQLNQEVAEDEMGRGSSEAVIEDAFSSAMQDYIEQARGAGPGTREMSLDDYKKEFAEATGIDISGKVDKSSALMAFGLALMQNRAGKGFNVGRMLSSVGKAGEVALPALEKAKTQARNDAIAAGKYALETRASDRAIDAANQEKLMDRGKYWVYKKGGKGAEFSQFDKGEFVNLNKFELNKLINNPEFDKNYEFINAEKRFDILKARAEALDKDPDKSWSSKGYERISLIGGDPKETPFELTVQGVTRDANYELKPGEYNMKLGETKESVIDRMIGYQKDINKDSKMFGDLLKFIDDGGVSIPAQIVSRVKQFARSLGFNEGKATDPASARRLLQNIAIDEATRILQESGKTLSDTDRQLVQKRVSDINFTLEGSDPAIIKRQIQDVYDLVVTKAQDNLDRSIRALGRDFGVFVYPAGQDDIPESQEELDAMNKEYNTNLTMDDYKK